MCQCEKVFGPLIKIYDVFESGVSINKVKIPCLFLVCVKSVGCYPPSFSLYVTLITMYQ